MLNISILIILGLYCQGIKQEAEGKMAEKNNVVIERDSPADLNGYLD
jgi:hypothetical protein